MVINLRCDEVIQCTSGGVIDNWMSLQCDDKGLRVVLDFQYFYKNGPKRDKRRPRTLTSFGTLKGIVGRTTTVKSFKNRRSDGSILNDFNNSWNVFNRITLTQTHTQKDSVGRTESSRCQDPWMDIILRISKSGYRFSIWQFRLEEDRVALKAFFTLNPNFALILS